MQNKQEMPKWFDGTVYSTGDTVSNPFTGESVELTAEELSMYDLIMGAQMLQAIRRNAKRLRLVPP